MTETATHQIAWVYDLNKCIGCQTCSVACKVLWTRDEGEKHEWWCSVNTQPGLGTPKGWETMGGGVDPKTGKRRRRAISRRARSSAAASTSTTTRCSTAARPARRTWSRRRRGRTAGR